MRLMNTTTVLKDITFGDYIYTYPNKEFPRVKDIFYRGVKVGTRFEYKENENEQRFKTVYRAIVPTEKGSHLPHLTFKTTLLKKENETIERVGKNIMLNLPCETYPLEKFIEVVTNL